MTFFLFNSLLLDTFLSANLASVKSFTSAQDYERLDYCNHYILLIFPGFLYYRMFNVAPTDLVEELS